MNLIVKTGRLQIGQGGELEEESVEISNGQQSFLDELMSGENIFLTGKAGTGKSFAVNIAKEELRKRKKRFACVAPTGIAANNIDGQTIHSLFGIQPFGIIGFDECKFLKTEKRILLNAIETLFIDEVSMLRPDILDAMHWTLIKNGCTGLNKRQIIFVGDPKQLPPVVKDMDKSILFSKGYNSVWFCDAQIYKELSPKEICLTEVLRQNDEEFITNLNELRDGGRPKYFAKFYTDTPDVDGVTLAPHNETVQEYNRIGLDLLQGDTLEFEAQIEGDIKISDTNFESTLKIKDGCKVMFLVNIKDSGLFNGCIGELRIRDGILIFFRDGLEYCLERYKVQKKDYVFNKEIGEIEQIERGSITQYPIKLAYALSIHKSQGMTFDKVNVDLRRKCFADGQLYVALSRVKSPDGLKIIV